MDRVSHSNGEVEVGGEPTVDETSTRGKWVTSYRPNPPKSEIDNEPTVDTTSTRGQWVSSYRKWGAGKTINHWVID